MINILHLSDLHIRTAKEAETYRSQLEADLKVELNIKQLDYLVISGDIAHFSTPEEYEAAFKLVEQLISHFELDASRVVIVPGNHDVNYG